MCGATSTGHRANLRHFLEIARLLTGDFVGPCDGAKLMLRLVTSLFPLLTAEKPLTRWKLDAARQSGNLPIPSMAMVPLVAGSTGTTPSLLVSRCMPALLLTPCCIPAIRVSIVIPALKRCRPRGSQQPGLGRASSWPTSAVHTSRLAGRPGQTDRVMKKREAPNNAPPALVLSMRPKRRHDASQGYGLAIRTGDTPRRDETP